MSEPTVLGHNLQENFDAFIFDAIETGCVWGLEGERGFALCPSEHNGDIDVMPLWSQPEWAQHHCKDEWSDYKPVPIALDELLEEWLPGMHGDVIMVGINWNTDLEGIEIEPLDLVDSFDDALQE